MAQISHSGVGAQQSFYRPHETAPQAGTMMSWPTEFSITAGKKYHSAGSDIKQTREEVACIAQTIAKYQPLHMFVLDPKSKEMGCYSKNTNLKTAEHMLGGQQNITLYATPNVCSLWARDTGPVSVYSLNGPVDNIWTESDYVGAGFEISSTSSTLVGLDLSYNQWGRKQPITPDHYLAATAAQHLNISAVHAPFVSEGGAIEVDGEGTLLATESSILNPNRNPGINKATMERYFAIFLGITKTIWLPGERGQDITDDHIDALARFASPGTVLLSRAFNSSPNALADYESAKAILSNATDAKGRSLRVVDVPEPDPDVVLGDDYNPDEAPSVSYVNFLVVNGAVIMAKFGDDIADAEAKRIIGEAFPDRVIEQVYIHQLPVQGGGIHCATQQLLPANAAG